MDFQAVSGQKILVIDATGALIRTTSIIRYIYRSLYNRNLINPTRGGQRTNLLLFNHRHKLGIHFQPSKRNIK